MAADTSRLLLYAAMADLVIAVALAVLAAYLLRRFISRLVECHLEVARELTEPAEGRVYRLYAYLKARESRSLNDPRAHAFAFGAYLCVWLALFVLVLAALSLIAAPFF